MAEDPGFFSPLVITLSDLLTNDSDVDGPLPLTASRTGDVTHGTLFEALGIVWYWPDADYRGPDSFSYETCDDAGACDGALVRIDVTPVNDVPVANPDGDLLIPLTTPEDQSLDMDVLANDVLGDDPALGDYDVVVSAPARADHGDLTVNGDNTITYAPDADYFGPDSFTYTVTDTARGGCDQRWRIQSPAP